MKPLLSVLIISYNHEQYIEQTLDSVISQKTTFPFEIVIGDDASPDKTRAICLKYAEKYPNLIRVMPKTKNLGVVPNYIRTLKACEGQYIAHLDGDDYWIDPLKLQKQVDKLRTNSDFIMCYTSRQVFREDWKDLASETERAHLKNYYGEDLGNGFFSIKDGEDNKYYRVEDFCGNTFFHLSTLVFKKPVTDVVINHLARFKNIVDRPLSIILLQELGGYAVKIPDVCIVFRMNKNSLFSPADEIKRNRMTNEMYATLNELYPNLSKHFNYHLNVSAYFELRHAYRQKDKTTVRTLATQIISRPTFKNNWQLKFKAALHLF